MKEAKPVEGKVTISSPTCGDSLRYVAITVRDVGAVTDALEVRVSLEEFTKALMGLACVPAEIHYGKLERLGLKREVKELKIELTEKHRHDKVRAAALACSLCMGDSWIPELYFNSRDSFFEERIDGVRTYFARTSAHRWVKHDDC